MVIPWRVILASAVIFVAGAITGGFGTRLYAPKIVHKTHVIPPLSISHERRQDYLAKLDRELQLTPDQRQQVESILKASQQRIKALWQQIEPNTKQEYYRTRAEIAALLTPEQLEKMKRMRHGRDKKKDAVSEEKKGPKPEARLCRIGCKNC